MSSKQHSALVFAGALSSLIALACPAVSQVLSPNLLYTSIQPCRLFDTRVAGGALVANVSRDLDAAGISAAGSLSSQGGNASGCPIPANTGSPFDQVQAIDVNLAAVTPAGTGVLQAWPSDQSKPNASVLTFTAAEVVLANGVVLPVRQGNAEGDITVVSNVGTHALGDVVGYFSGLSPLQGSTNAGQLFVGTSAGNPGVATPGQGINTALGSFALEDSTTGTDNNALGANTLGKDTTGSNNTALGYAALGTVTTGSDNVAVGYLAGNFVAGTGGESSNILIGNEGAAGESNTIQIGQANAEGVGPQTSTYIAGIHGVALSGGTEVFINASGQLGTTTSSRRFKEDIADMGAASHGLLELRPVTFHYKSAYDDGSHLLQYGLIAEEVAKIYPELVEFDKDGRPLAVRYHFVNAMLLNEVQKQHATIASQAAQLDQRRSRLDTQERTIASQAAKLVAQRARLDEFEAQVRELEAHARNPR